MLGLSCRLADWRFFFNTIVEVCFEVCEVQSQMSFWFFAGLYETSVFWLLTSTATATLGKHAGHFPKSCSTSKKFDLGGVLFSST